MSLLKKFDFAKLLGSATDVQNLLNMAVESKYFADFLHEHEVASRAKKMTLETTFMRIEKAAEILSTDVDTLLMAGCENRIQLYWFLNRDLKVRKVGFSTGNWTKKYFGFIRLSYFDARYILELNNHKVGYEIICLDESISFGSQMLFDNNDDDDNDFNYLFWSVHDECAEERVLTKYGLFVRSSDINKIMVTGKTPEEGDVLDKAIHAEDSHLSDNLMRVLQAARKFWGNADRHDRSTHPANADVAAWLQERGFSKNLAGHAASIIRPEWASAGRKPR